MGSRRLSDYAMDVTSQNGEDGMIAELLSRMGISGGWCAELGAWDGRHLSNTWSLWHEQGWSAVLIEGDKARASALAASTTDLGRVHVIEAYASAGSSRSLDALFAQTPMPHRFEVLSIDVDGDDFHLFSDLRIYRPLVVVVEHNVSFPPEIEFVQEPGTYVGSSAAALVNLAEEKGYRLAGLTTANLIFVDRQSESTLTDLETDLVTLFDRAWLPVTYSDFAGHHFVLQPGSWGYTAASRHGKRTAAAQLQEAATVVCRRTRLRLGKTKHRLASMVKAEKA